MKIKILPKAVKSLEKFPKSTRRKIVSAIDKLSQNFPKINDLKKLTVQPGYRLRVGDYRVLFIRQDETLIIVRISHRKDAYR